jgi:hypothetical protein
METVRRAKVHFKEARSSSSEFTIQHYDLKGGFLCLTLTEDLRPPGVKRKIIVFPSDIIQSITIEDIERTKPEGFRESNHFREVPGDAKHIPGGKLP